MNACREGKDYMHTSDGNSPALCCLLLQLLLLKLASSQAAARAVYVPIPALYAVEIVSVQKKSLHPAPKAFSSQLYIAPRTYSKLPDSKRGNAYFTAFLKL